MLAALRFLAREAQPGPFCEEAGAGQWRWVGAPESDLEHWWRYDAWGPPPGTHGEAEQLADAEAGFAAWLRAGGA